MNDKKHFKLIKQTGAVSLAIIVLITLLSISLPVATKLVQQNQENRSQATTGASCSTVADRGNRKCSADKKQAAMCTVSVWKNTDLEVINDDAIADQVKKAEWNWVTCPSGKECNSSTGMCELEPTINTVCSANEHKCENNVLKKCNDAKTGWKTVNSCTSDEICSVPLKKCVNKTTCKDGNVGVLVGDKRCIDNKMKTCLKSGSFNSGDPCGTDKKCNTAGTACVEVSNPQKPTCTSKNGTCVADSSTCKYAKLGTVVNNTTCDDLSKVCCKNISTAASCTSQGGVCVTTGTCTGTKLTATGCTSTKPDCCKSAPTPTPPKCSDKTGGTCAATCSDGYYYEPMKSSCLAKYCCKPKPETTSLRVSSIEFDVSSIKLEKDFSQNIHATVKPDGVANKSLSWSSSNESVAIVTTSGSFVIITAKGLGTATITATSQDGSNIKKTVTVTVGTIEVSSIEVSSSSLTLKQGDTYTLKATVKPDKTTNKNLSWSSLKNEIATVDNNGKVTAVNPGTGEIRVASTDNSGVDEIIDIKVVCPFGEYKCDGRNLMLCRTDGLKWELNKECGIDQTCDVVKKTCTTKALSPTLIPKPKCVDKGGICVNNLFTCGDKYSGKTISGTDCVSICCEKLIPPTTTTCTDQKGICQPFGECRADNGTSIGKFDCTGTNVCCQSNSNLLSINPPKSVCKDSGGKCISVTEIASCKSNGGTISSVTTECSSGTPVCCVAEPKSTCSQSNFSEQKCSEDLLNLEVCSIVNGVYEWKKRWCLGSGCDPKYNLCKAKCGVEKNKTMTKDEFSKINLCQLGIVDNSLTETKDGWSWFCLGALYAPVECSAINSDISNQKDCKVDTDCVSFDNSGSNLTKCVDEKCMKPNSCVTTKHASTTINWTGSTCSQKDKTKMLVCNNVKNQSSQDFRNFSEVKCEIGCQNGKCKDGKKCASAWVWFTTKWYSENYVNNKKTTSDPCPYGCNQTNGECFATQVDANVTPPVSGTISQCSSKGGYCLESLNECKAEQGTSYGKLDCGTGICCVTKPETNTTNCDPTKDNNNDGVINSLDKFYCNNNAGGGGGGFGSLGSFCATDNICDSKICVNKTCTSGKIDSLCVDNNDCVDGNKCNLTTHKCFSGVLGSICTQNSECGSNICASGVCSKSAKDCSWSLKHGSNDCSADSTLTYCDNGEIKEIQPCEFGCKNGKCLDGLLCSSNYSGKTYRHNETICTGNNSDDSVSGNNFLFTCYNGNLISKECPLGCKNGTCELNTAEYCGNDGSKCMSGICENNYCVKSALYGKCSKPSDCETNSCNFGRCLTPDSECDPNFPNGKDFLGCKPNQDCRSTSGVGGYKCVTDGKCGLANTRDFSAGNPPTTGDVLCEFGDNTPVTEDGISFKWKCKTKDNGSKEDSCTANKVDGCPVQNLKNGESRCIGTNTLEFCTPEGIQYQDCYVSIGTYCLDKECKKIDAPQKKGDYCIPMKYSFRDCPENLFCVNNKCVTQEENDKYEADQNKVQTVPCSQSVYKLSLASGIIYTCENKNESCDIEKGICVSAPTIKHYKKGGEPCDSNLECISGYCNTYGITSAHMERFKECSERTQEESIELENQINTVALDVGIMATTLVGGQILSGISIVQKITTVLSPAISTYRLGTTGVKAINSIKDIFDGGDVNTSNLLTLLYDVAILQSPQSAFNNITGSNPISDADAVNLFTGAVYSASVAPIITENSGDASAIFNSVAVKGLKPKYLGKGLLDFAAKKLIGGNNSDNPINYGDLTTEQQGAIDQFYLSSQESDLMEFSGPTLDGLIDSGKNNTVKDMADLFNL